MGLSPLHTSVTEKSLPAEAGSGAMHKLRSSFLLSRIHSKAYHGFWCSCLTLVKQAEIYIFVLPLRRWASRSQKPLQGKVVTIGGFRSVCQRSFPTKRETELHATHHPDNKKDFPPSALLFSSVYSRVNSYCTVLPPGFSIFLDVSLQALWGRKASSPVHFLCYPCKLVIHGSVCLRWSEKQKADTANTAEHFHKETALAKAGEAKEHGKGEHLEVLFMCPAVQVNTAGPGALPSFPGKDRANSFPEGLL